MISFKKIFVTLLLLCIGMAARAGNVVTISSVEGAPGEEVMVSLSLQNSDAVTALQVSIPIDEELTLVEGSAQIGSRSQGHSVTVGVKDGQLNVMVWSLSMAALTGTDGVVASWRMKLGNQPKTISLTPTKAVLTNPDGQNVETTSHGGTVQITCAKAQYSQMTVDFGRVPIRSTYHETVTVSNIGNADLTVSNIIFSDVNVFSTETALPLTISPGGSEQIEITYAPVERGNISRTMQVVCNSISKLNTIELKAQPFAVNELHIDDATGISDGETTIHLRMNNMDGISGFQFEFQLPEALEYVNGSFTLSDRKADHQLVCTNNGGVLKAIAYSSSNQTFSGEDGELASFRVLLKGHDSHPVEAQKAVLSATIKGKTEDVLSAKYGGMVTIASPTISASSDADMGAIPVTEEATYSYTISNYGNAPLTVSRIVFDNENLSVDETLPLTINPWENQTVTLRYNSVEQKPYTSIMQIYSNDPTRRVMNVNVSGSRFAPNYLNVVAKDVLTGDTLKVDVSLNIYDEISALQFDVTYPKEFDGYDNNAELAPTVAGMTITRRSISATKDRYFCYFLDGRNIAAGQDKLLTLGFAPKATAESGNYSISVTDIKLGTSSMSDKYAGTNQDISVTVQPAAVVTFVFEGQIIKKEKIQVGNTITPPSIDAKEGYSFSGWNNLPSAMPDHDIEVTGSYVINQYTLKFVADGQVVSETLLDFGSAISAPQAPAKEGYTFVSWGNVASTMPAKDVTYTAEYNINQYTVTFKVDGEVFKTFTQDYGSNITIPAEPSKEGYSFSGWKNVVSTMPAQNLIYEAIFSINQYTLKFVADGQVVSESSVDFGSVITAPQAPAKGGYTFVSWGNVASTMPASDVTYTAEYRINQHIITFIADGKVFETLTLDYGSNITIPATPAKEGYTFEGWGSVPATMPDNDLTFTATYSINQYTVVYKVDGEIYKEYTLDYGTGVTVPPTPQKEGHSFSGWNTKIAETMPANDLEYTGSFLINPYTITYYVNGEEYYSTSANYGSQITPIDNPQKTGYTFSGWDNVPSTMPANDVDIRGTFSVNQYTVTFKVDGEVYTSYTLDYGTAIAIPEAPTKEGHTFSGWNTKIAETVPANDLEYTGSFSVNSYKLTYFVDNEEYYTTSVNYGSQLIPQDNPQKTGYTFSGWDNVPSTMPANDVVVRGTFSINQYTVTFNIDGEVFKTFTQDYGTAITMPEAPAKEGHTFSGWKNVASSVPAQDITYEATFSVNKYTLKFVADNSVVSEESVDFGSTINVPQAPAKEGYTFASWGEVASTMPAKDVTYTAEYKINQYSVVFKIDGEVYKAFTQDFGTIITVPEVPVKEGYTFSGWNTKIAETVPANDLEYTGTFNVNSYKLTYFVDNEEYYTTSVNYGSQLIPQDNPQKTGYTFSGWDNVPSTMPANDVVVRGIFSINQYTVTFKIDGEVFKTFTQDYGTAITMPEAPAKEGHTFSGWQNVASSVPAQDITYEATFSVNKYMLKFVADDNIVSEEAVDFGSAITAPEAPAKEGYTFVSWGNVAATMPAKDVTYTAEYRVNQYTLKFMADGKTVSETSIDFGSAISAPQAPAKEGYTFVTWGEVASKMPAKDVTYTAEYKVNQYTVTFKVDGEVFKTFTQDYGSNITIPAAPSKEGYSFSGWQNVVKTVPAEDVVYEANFTVNQYTLKFVADGIVVSEKSMDYGSTINIPQAPAKEGYSFMSWGNVAETMPAKNITYTAEYKVNQYKLTYLIDGRVYKTYMIDFGSEITPEDEAEDDDYYYGWEDVPETMPAHDVEVNAYITKVLGWAKSIDKNTTIYTLDGQKILIPQKGNIYIINGKKVKF